MTAKTGNEVTALLLTLVMLLATKATPEESPLHPQHNSQSPLQRRADFRRRLDCPHLAEETMQRGLKDTDPVIRRRAVFECYRKHGQKAKTILLTMAKDPQPLVMDIILACGKDMKEKFNDTELLAAIAKNSSLQATRRQAEQLVSFTFYRENRRLKDNPAFDHDLVSVKLMQLPLKGWKFRADATARGHVMGFFNPDFDDSAWTRMDIGNWESQGYDGYDGIAWYRIRFDMPDKKPCEAVELAFDAVDESAWVWLNGTYIGQHDVGPSGWDKPFWLDVTREIRWNAPNVLVVRVEDTAHAGGIWKPVSVEVLK